MRLSHDTKERILIGMRMLGTDKGIRGYKVNGRVAKKIRKMTRRHGMEYLREIRGWRFINRWHLCWWILFGNE